jgi:hypothetical protein
MRVFIRAERNLGSFHASLGTVLGEDVDVGNFFLKILILTMSAGAVLAIFLLKTLGNHF